MIDLLVENNIEYVSTYNSRPTKNGYRVNFDSYEEIRNFVELHRPTVCVNCIVQRLTDVCEKDWDETKRVNIDIVDRLSKVCAEFGVYLLHISTDYVFDGKIQPNMVGAAQNPLQNYGISKLISEMRVSANASLYAIVRVPVLYCDAIENLEENAVTLIGKKVLNQIHKTSEDDYSIRRPVYIPDFCKYLLSLIQTPKNGTFHFYNPYDRLTKYEIAKKVAEFLGKSHAHIAPSNIVNSNVANRPYDTELKDSQYSIDAYSFTPLDEGIRRCFYKWKHPALVGSVDANKCFLLMDLDGTLLDTDKVHYEAYKSALSAYNVELLYSDFEKAINNTSIDVLLTNLGIPITEFENVKKAKYSKMVSSEAQVKLLDGVEEFLESCLTNGVNMAIVTNTSRNVVDFYKRVVPILNRIPNWICREDYNEAKPNDECYKLATARFYKNEPYTIGFENTLNGYNAIKSSVDCVYFITDKQNTNYSKMTKEDVFMIPDFRHFLA
jgi:dTDP-4-dehydrorhamnose reductase/beta-phosphoglucomutase-like phosphatase (HAD superfamily)